MCGRIVIRASRRQFEQAFDAEPDAAADFAPRYNLAPTETMPVVLQLESGGKRLLTTMRWGFASSLDSPALINARSESVAQRPAFREAFHQRRCLVAADAFYEWKRAGKLRQPFLIEMSDSRPFALAAIWQEPRENKTSADLRRCCILTTESNPLIRPLHHRMPVILAPEDYARWLDPSTPNAASLKEILQPFRAERMRLYPVSTAVNKAGIDCPELIQPLDPAEAVAPELISKDSMQQTFF